VYRDCTNSVLIVKKLKSSHKTVKTAKNNHWCTNRHMSTNTVPTVYQWSKTVKRQLKQQKGPLVYQSSHVYQDCTNSVPLVKNSQKAVKTAKMTIGVQIVTCLHRVRLIHKVWVRVPVRVRRIHKAPIGSRTGAFQRTHYWIPTIEDGWDPPSWKSTWRHFFLPRVVRFG